MYYLEIQGLKLNLAFQYVLYELCIMIILACPYTPLPPSLGTRILQHTRLNSHRILNLLQK